MKIEIMNRISISTVIKKLKQVTMLKDQFNLVYKKAYISLESFNPEDLFPCQYYILKRELDSKIQLMEAFKETGVDILNLKYAYEFKVDNKPSIRTLLPPIIEESIEPDGCIYPLINDGMHRVFLSKISRQKISAIYIRGASELYYAYPLPDKWFDVKVITEITKNTVKKIHRLSNNKELYRNFDSVFTNCSKPRGLTIND